MSADVLTDKDQSPEKIAARGLNEPEENVLDILANIAGLREACRIDNAKRNAEHARERLREKCLARARRADQKNVRFLELDIRAALRQFEPLVMLIHGY